MAARLRAAFYRGGTSKAVVFNAADLPEDAGLRDRIFLAVLGSPDPYGRQLDGMGGGLSSLSKVVIVAPSARDDADVDYTFVQIAVREPLADYGSACGNMSSCVGPFALDEGMVSVPSGATEAQVRIFNTNTDQIYHARFAVKDGKPREDGDFAIAGVAGTGARVTLDFIAPGGSRTGALLPTGNATDRLTVAGGGEIEASLIDAANPVVFVRASDLGQHATEAPQTLDSDPDLMTRIEAIRRAGAVKMGLADSADATGPANPKIAMVAVPAPFDALDGTGYAADSHQINVRLVSMGNFHRAITLTGGLCTAVAAQIPGSLVAQIARPEGPLLHIGTASGILPVTADVAAGPDGVHARSAGTFRTQRRLMEGAVLFPESLLETPS